PNCPACSLLLFFPLSFFLSLALSPFQFGPAPAGVGLPKGRPLSPIAWAAAQQQAAAFDSSSSSSTVQISGRGYSYPSYLRSAFWSLPPKSDPPHSQGRRHTIPPDGGLTSFDRVLPEESAGTVLESVLPYTIWSHTPASGTQP